MLEQAAGLGSPDAKHNLALLNLENKMKGNPPNDVYAFNQFLQAAQAGKLANFVLLRVGIGTKKNFHYSGHVESAMKLVNYYYEGIDNLLPVVRKDAVSWAKFVVYSVDPELSKLTKLATELKLKGSMVKSALVYSVGGLLGHEISGYNAAWLAERVQEIDNRVIRTTGKLQLNP